MAAPSCRRQASFASAALFLAVAGGVGACGKTMTASDCERVGKHMRDVWDAEADASAPEKGPQSERAKHTIKSVGEKMQTDWRSQCERELEGRKVDEQEVECILASKTVADLQRCGTAKR